MKSTSAEVDAARASTPDAPMTERRTWLRLTEIFYSIQGESSYAGMPCTFIRLARCNLRCTWCDTTYSFKGGDKVEIDDIIDRITKIGGNLVEITGGEPLLQPAVHDLMTKLLDLGFEVIIETSGSMDISPIDARVGVIMDLKAPGSGEVAKNRFENIKALKPSDEVKIVIADRIDYDWAVETVNEHDLLQRCRVIFSPVHGEMSSNQLANWILEDKLPIRLGLQIHKFLDVE